MDGYDSTMKVCMIEGDPKDVLFGTDHPLKASLCPMTSGDPSPSIRAITRRQLAEQDRAYPSKDGPGSLVVVEEIWEDPSED